MTKQLLRELELYIGKYLNEDILIKETMSTDYGIMPMRSAYIMEPEHKEGALPDKDEEDDKRWLEQFRKRPVPRVKVSKDKSFSKGIIPDEAELEDYINKERLNETFSTKLLYYIDRSKLSDSEIYKRAGIDRRHFSKIRCDKYYQPKKATAIALCIALKLNLVETTQLLGMAGYSLSGSDTGDLVVKFCIERGIYDLIEINEALDYFGQKLLGVVG